MWKKIGKIVLEWILKKIGYKPIDPEEKKRINWARDAEEMIEKEQRKELEKEKDEWEDASIEEKQSIILRRFPKRDRD